MSKTSTNQKATHDPVSKKAATLPVDTLISVKYKIRAFVANVWRTLLTLWRKHKILSPTIIVLSLICIIAVVPPLRYGVLGPFVKRTAIIKIVDSKTTAPVSGAEVIVGNKKVITDATGIAHVTVPVGEKMIKIQKQYYKWYAKTRRIPIFGHLAVDVNLVATGRQAPLYVVNNITDLPVSGARISYPKASSRTDKNGKATVVLPVAPSPVILSIKADGYNVARISIATSKPLGPIKVDLTPSGKIYFLSNLSGKTDVVKANLDGSDRQTVLPGTGNEDSNTALVASPDWKYIALLSKRSASSPAKLYIIQTSNDHLTTIDEGNASFAIKGWVGDSLIYTTSRDDMNVWQPGWSKLKSYDPTSSQMHVLDETSGSGDSYSNTHEYFSFVFLTNNVVLYAKNWSAYSPYYINGILDNDQHHLFSISPNGQHLETLASYDAAPLSVSFLAHSPNTVYIRVVNTQNGGKEFSYQYTLGDSVPKPLSISSDQFYQANYTYLFSPDHAHTLWTEQRDGQTALIEGDTLAQNSHVVTTVKSGYAYGWFTGKYVLFANSNDLYVMSAGGGALHKITGFEGQSSYGIVP